MPTTILAALVINSQAIEFSPDINVLRGVLAELSLHEWPERLGPNANPSCLISFANGRFLLIIALGPLRGLRVLALSFAGRQAFCI